MQQLKVLEDAGLVIAERRGRERWNHLDAMPIQDIHDRWIGPHAAAATARLARFKQAVEADSTRPGNRSPAPLTHGAVPAATHSPPTCPCSAHRATSLTKLRRA